MDALEFWRVNQNIPFDAGYSVWSARYQGTLDDFAVYRETIDTFFRSHARHRGQSLVTLVVLPDDDGFLVFGITA